MKLVERSLEWSAVNGSLGSLGGAMLWKPEGPGMEKWVAGGGGRPSVDQVQAVAGQPGVYKTLPGFPMPATAAVGDSLTYMLRQAHTVAIGNSSKVVMEDVTTLTTLGLNFCEETHQQSPRQLCRWEEPILKAITADISNHS